MTMHVWTDHYSFLAVAHSQTVAQSRALLAFEMGGSDGSCTERDRARKIINEEAPSIWTGLNAEFAITDSAAVVEAETENTALREKLATVRSESFNACIELLESRKRYWDGGDLARVGEYANFVKELDRLIEQMASVRDGKDGRP